MNLINDAEFTATTSLPSVTFDVNNSYVAEQLGQRVGEEVSHFYHPTPPPRNPNGFWQRFEQRYESVFEHRALIAEGRAAANSKVMSESLGHAAANEQNYLDLGYTDSNAQYGAGWIGISEVPAPKGAALIQKGIQATRFLAENKWGFFGHGVQSLETGIPQIGQKVYRVWGGEAGSYGRSWTRTDPSAISDYRSKAGLPNQNEGRFISEGNLTDIEGVKARSALPLHEHPGGLDELLIPNSREQVELENVSGINPQY